MITKTEYDKRKTKRLPYISQSVEDDGWIEQLTDITKLLIKFLPTILGLFDETTDILYLFLTDFAYATLKYIFIICLLFSPILQMLVWTFFFASHQLNRYLKKNVLYNTLNKKYMELYINKYYSNRSYYASYIFYILASIVYVCIFLFLSLLNLGKGFLYALGSELKILPFYLSYHYQNELKYEITEDLV